MGQKVHPIGFRLGYTKTWRSRWYAEKDYAVLLHEDLALKKDLKKRFAHAGVSRVEIERAANKLKITIHTSRPGIIIGRKGQEVDKLKQECRSARARRSSSTSGILKPELTRSSSPSQWRCSSRSGLRSGAPCARRSTRRCARPRGIKIRVSGRLNGAAPLSGTCGQLPLHAARGHRLRLPRPTRPSGRSASRPGSSPAS